MKASKRKVTNTNNFFPHLQVFIQLSLINTELYTNYYPVKKILILANNKWKHFARSTHPKCAQLVYWNFSSRNSRQTSGGLCGASYQGQESRRARQSSSLLCKSVYYIPWIICLVCFGFFLLVTPSSISFFVAVM